MLLGTFIFAEVSESCWLNSVKFTNNDSYTYKYDTVCIQGFQWLVPTKSLENTPIQMWKVPNYYTGEVTLVKCLCNFTIHKDLKDK